MKSILLSYGRCSAARKRKINAIIGPLGGSIVSYSGPEPWPWPRCWIDAPDDGRSQAREETMRRALDAAGLYPLAVRWRK